MILNGKYKGQPLKKYFEENKSHAVPFDNEISERFYSLRLFKNLSEYKNDSDSIVCLTIIEGGAIIENIHVQKGSSIILEPDETLFLNPSAFIVSKPL